MWYRNVFRKTEEGHKYYPKIVILFCASSGIAVSKYYNIVLIL